MNKLLQRQIAKYLGSTDAIPAEVEQLLKVINESYDHFEKDRKMLERSIEISSKEMVELNAKLRKDTEEGSKVLYKSLKESLAFLNDTKAENSIPEVDFHKLSQIANILRDETKKRKKSEREMRQRSAHLEASQRITHTGSWEMDLTNINDSGNNDVYWSDETYRIFGFEPGSVKVTQNTCSDIIPPDDWEAIQIAVKKAIDECGVYDIEHRVVLPDGTEKIVHERGNIIKNETTGKSVKMIGTVQDITERKRADQQLRKVNYELKTLFDNMQECVFTVDATIFQLIQISPSCEDIYGYTVDEFMNNGNLWIDIVIEEDKALIWAKHPLLEKGESITNSYRIRDKKGNIRWLESKIKPTLNKEGKLVRMDGVTADITKRIEAKQALKDSEYRFRSLIENAADAIMIIDETTRIAFASDSLYKILGYKPDEVLGTTSFNSIYKEDIPLLQSQLKKVLETPGITFPITYRRVKKDGTVIWCEGTGTNLLHMPAVKGIVVNFRDVTERIAAEKALVDSEFRFRSLIENSADAMMILDETTKITFASDSVYKILGYRPDEIRGKASYNTIYIGDMPVTQEMSKKVLETPGTPFTLTYRRVKKDGTVIWCEGTATNLLHIPAVNGIVVNFRDVTDRILSEKALIDSEYKFRSLIENSSDATVVVNENFEVTFASDSLSRVTGFTPEDVVGKQNSDTVYDEDRDIAETFLKEVLRTPGEAKTIIYRLKKKNGDIIWTERVATNLINDPVIKGIVINFRDITENKKAEIALKDSENKFRSLIQNSTDVITVIDEAGNFIFVSDSIYKVTGYRSEDLMGLPSIPYVHPDDLNILKECREQIANDPTAIITTQYRRLKKDGSYIWVEASVNNLLHEPAVRGIVVNFRDITENKKAEAALKDSEHKFRSLIKNASDVITVVSKDSRFLYASDSLYTVTGYKPEEILGLNSMAFVHPDDAVVLTYNREKILDNYGKIISARYRRLRKDGSYIWVEGTVNNLLHEPAVKGIVINFRDITERIAYEEALKTSNEELKKSNSEMDRFVYSVSHDLKAPLSSMLGVLSLIESETTDNNISGDIQLLKKSIHKLDGFINDILDYSRNARLEVKSKEIYFTDILDDIKNNLKYMASVNTNVDIRTIVDNGLPYYSDEGRINVILNNLISNAIRYSNPKESAPFVEVYIQVKKEEAVLIVRDNGVGISKEHTGKIFDMFFRVSKKSVGSGLGLYIVKETVEKLNGSIQVDSEIDKGTKFTIVLPNLANNI